MARTRRCSRAPPAPVPPIAGQRQAHEAYAQQHGLVISKWFVDEAKPGGSTTGRDAFNDMIYLARREPRQADGILLWDLRRFARNLLDSQFYKADLRRRGWTLIFLSDDIPKTDFAPVYEALLEWKAQKDRDNISKDAQRGLRTLAKMGYAPGGFPPRGYKAETLTVEIEGKQRQVRRWVPDPQLWDTAKKAWAMRAVGASYTEILAATGLYNSQPGLHAFFNNRTYLGIRKCGDLEVEGAHEPLITPETWDAAQQLKQRHPRTGARKRHPRRQRSRYLLSGLLHCGQCGAAMCGSYSPARQMKDGNRAEWRFYICGRKTREHLQACPSSRLKAEMLEDAVLHTIVDTVLTPEHLQHLLEDTNSALTAKRDDLTQRQKRLECDFAEVDRRIARLLDALEQGKSGAIRERLERRERERKRLQGEWQTVEERLKASTLEISPAALQTLIGEMHHVLKSGDVRKTHRLLRTLVVRIEATRQGGVLYYTFAFRPADTYTLCDGLGALSLMGW